MAKPNTISVKGLEINIAQINDTDFVSITDIAKQVEDEPRFTIRNWMRNASTLEFLEQWETIHNPNFNRAGSGTVRLNATSNSFSISPTKWIKETNAIGILTKGGRYGGGTYVHRDIALNFCYWLSPAFQVFFIKAFQELIESDFDRRNLKWHISKITNNIDEVRNLLDTIPGQAPDRNRLNFIDEKED